MLCRKCKKEIPDDSNFCNHCGIKQIIEKPKKARGNSQGSVYKNKKGKWVAEVTLGYDKSVLEDGTIKLLRKKATKSGFSTKKDALEYLPQLKQNIQLQDPNVKFKEFFEKWIDIHAEKVTKSTINCYKSAFKYFKSLYYIKVNELRTEHLQECVDKCPKGQRTKKNMKFLCTALWRYAIQLDIVDRNYPEFIYIKPEEKKERKHFSQEQLDLFWENYKTEPHIIYILLLCYTGMRLGEMLNAETINYNPKEQYFITGSKTEAGKNRIITISPKISPFFKEFGKGKYLFFDDGVKPSEKKFRNEIFYPALQSVGLDIFSPDGNHLYTPHCCRHTFATLMKNIDAPATDKQKLIGHSKFEMTAYYTHTNIDSLKNITDNL